MTDLKLMTVMAHPDDETFGMGGTLALYADRGVEVHLVCATNGDAGTVSPEFMQGYSEIAELRQDELRCAAEALGVAEVYFLGYRDSGMIGTADNQHPDSLAQADKERVTGQIVELLRQVRPQVVVTHDPTGGYGHPDHIAVHQTTLAAFHAAGQPEQYPEHGQPFQPQKLYYSIIPLRFLGVLIRIARLLGQDPTRWGRNQDIDLTELSDNSPPVHAEVGYRRVAGRKRAATLCHASQLDMGASSRGLMGLLFRIARWRKVESFTRAHPPADDGRTERDLFAGVD